MSWLTPQGISGSNMSDPQKSVDAFVRDNGTFGFVVIETWNAVDPLHCFYVPDEYLGYAERFIEGLRRTLSEDRTPYLVEELVRRSFYPSEVCFDPKLGSPWVSPEDIKAIAQSIASAGPLLDKFS